MSTHPEHHDDTLERYLDGLLDSDRRANFERRLSQDPQLRHTVDQQARIDDAIKRLHPLPANVPTLDEIHAASADKRAHTSAPRENVWAKLAIAAGLLIATTAGVSVYEMRDLIWPAPTPSPPPPMSLSQTYAFEVEHNLTPDWVCENEAQFADTFENHTTLALAMPEATDTFAPIGLSPRRTQLHRRTLCLLARVDGRPVIVFAAPLESDVSPMPPTDAKLHLIRHQIGSAVFYELTPFKDARVLNRLRPTDLSPEEYDGKGW